MLTRETSPLASVQRIEFSGLIPKRDNLIAAKVLGFSVVINKTNFSDNSLCIFFEPDALLDSTNEKFAFLDSKNGRIVKRQKAYGVVSEGLALPLDVVLPYGLKIEDLIEGQDLTDAMKVTKYVSTQEQQIYKPKTLKALIPFPLHIVPKTDETNVQSSVLRDSKEQMKDTRSKVNILEAIVGRRLAITTKLDGTSMTVTSTGLVCGRNYAWNKEDIEGKVYWEMENKYEVIKKISDTSLSIQGEICGPKIQKNRLKLTENHWFVFNIFNSLTNEYLPHVEVIEWCDKLQLETVPCIAANIEYKEWPYKTLESLLQLADTTVDWNASPAEGIVVKTVDNSGPRISFKVLSLMYLI